MNKRQSPKKPKSLLATVNLFVAAFFVLSLSGCVGGPSLNGSFEKTYAITAHVRLELANASGSVDISHSNDNQVHIHGEVRASGFGFTNPQQRLADVVSNPPIEQKGDTIRIGKDWSRLHNVSISYQIEVPQDTEVDASLASGAQTIRELRGPVHTRAASGSIRVENIERDVQLTTASGSIYAANISDELHASSSSGNIDISNVKGDLRVHAMSGTIHIKNPGARIDANTASGGIEVMGADSDVRGHTASGHIDVRGNPSGNSYWDLKTASGSVYLGVPSNSNFHLSAGAVSGRIHTDIPIVIEEQGKHSLRARVGNGGGRVEVHTVSGGIHVAGST